MSDPRENGWSEVYRVRLPITLDLLVRQEAKFTKRSVPQQIAECIHDRYALQITVERLQRWLEEAVILLKDQIDLATIKKSIYSGEECKQ